MKHWSYGINSYHRTASLLLNEAPWYVFFIEWLFDGILSCVHVPKIPFPNILPSKRNKIEDCACKNMAKQCEDHDQLYTLQEWYGDLGQWYHVNVCSPITEWAQKRVKSIDFEVDYDVLVQKFSVDKAYFDEQERLADEWRKEEKC